MERILSRIIPPRNKAKERDWDYLLSTASSKIMAAISAVNSQPGKGSTFNVYLPVIDDIDVEIESAEPASATKGKERILLIDDEAQIIDIEQQILERLGYKVTSKTDSEEALQEFGAQPDQFDLVITDMTMPKMTGDQLARKMMDIKPKIPVILCTGFNEAITEEKASGHGN